MTLGPGTQLGKYRLERLLGAGGMGAVWEAHDGDLDRKVALKVLRPGLAADSIAQGRLLREARAMARLKHPNVITVYDATTAEGMDLVAMELVEGETMAQWLARKPKPSAIIDALLAAGRGLAAAHAAGMIHRDFKPHNVLVEGDGARVLVTDFGLARAAEVELAGAPPPPPATDRATVEEAVALDATASLPGAAGATAGPGSDEQRARDRAGVGLAETMDVGAASRPTKGSSHGSLDSPLTRTGTLLGTPAYMAPEQFAGTAADARADQFAFCVTAWEALAGARPFDADTIAGIAAAQHRPPGHADKIPRRLRGPLARGLAHDARARWATMTDLLGAVERAWHRPRRLASLAITGAAFAAAVALFVSMRHRDDSLAPPTPPTPPSPPGAGEVVIVSGACTQRGAEAIASAWTPARRDELARHAPNLAGELALVDRWATDWVARYDANCADRADRDQAVKRECFEAQRDEVAGTLAVPRGSDLDPSTLDLVRVLPSPEACERAPRAVSPALPQDPAQRRAVEAMRGELVRLRTTDPRKAGSDQAIADLVARAQAIGYPPVYAEALQARAVRLQVLASQQPDPRRAELAAAAAYDEAALAAEAAGYDRSRVQSLFGQLESTANLPDQLNTIDTVVEHARVANERIGEPANVLVLDAIRGEIAAARGDWGAAIATLERARDAWQARGGRAIVARMAFLAAMIRSQRHAPGDLETALRAFRELAQTELLPAAIRKSAGELAELVAYRVAGKLVDEDGQPIEIDPDDPDQAKDPLLVGGGDPAGGALQLVSTGLAPGLAADPAPADLAARAARTSPVRFSIAPLDGTGAAIVVPAGPTGVATVPHLVPGRYRISAISETSLGDRRVVRAEAAVVAGKTATVTVDVAPRRPVEVRWQPRQFGVAAIVPGAAPATAGELVARVATAPWTAVSDVSAGGLPGHDAEWLARLSRMGAGAAVVCLVPGAQLASADDTVIQPAGDAKPLCQPAPP